MQLQYQLAPSRRRLLPNRQKRLGLWRNYFVRRRESPPDTPFFFAILANRFVGVANGAPKSGENCKPFIG